MTAGEAPTRAVVDALYAAFLAGDAAGMLDLMSEDVAVTFLAQGTYRGKPAVERFLTFSAGLLRDLDFHLEAVVVDGEIGCGIWWETARTADGQAWQTTGVDVIRVRSGRIVSLAMNNDAALSRRLLPPYTDAGK